MITSSHYTLILRSIVYELTKAMIKNDEGEDMKVVNDILITQCQKGIELGLKFQGQEEYKPQARED